MAAAGGDNTPNAFNFTDVTGVNPNTATQSNIVTISGITGAVLVSGTGGVQFSIDGGAFSSTQRTIQNNQTLQLQVTSATFSTQVSTTVTVGDTTDTWNVTTRAADTTPAAFSFTDASNVNPNTLTTSATITISGLEPNYTGISISASGADGKVDAGTSSLSGTFAASKTGLTTSATGTIVAAVQATSGTFDEIINVTVTCGGVSDTYTITTRSADEEPNAFTNAFTDVTGANPGTEYTSNTITISGLEPNYTGITVFATGGTIDAGTSSLSGTFAASKFDLTTSATGTIVVAARVTPTSFSTAYPVVVNCGTRSDTYQVTTRAADTTGTMSFVDQTNVNPSTLTTSTTITASGFEPNYTFTVSCTGGQIDAGTSSLSTVWATAKTVTTSGTGTFVIAARATSSATFLATVNVVVTAGDTSDTFSITTRAAAAGSFTFVDQSGVEPGVTVTSSTITATGFEPNTTYNITRNVGGTLVDAGTTSLSGTFATSKTVTTSGSGTFVLAAQGTSATFSGAVNILVSAQHTTGGTVVSDTFTITTRAADTEPNSFAGFFTDQTGVERNAERTSNTITINGLEPNYPVTVQVTNGGGTVDAGTTVLSGSFATSKSVTTSGSGSIVVAARCTSSSSFSTTVGPLVVVGSQSDTFSVTTRAADETPTSFTNAFNDVTGAERNTLRQSNTVTISGLEPNYSITVQASGGGAQIDAGTSSLSTVWATSKTVTTSATGTIVVAARLTSSGSFSASVSTTITVGTASDTWSVTTRSVTLGTVPVFNTVGSAELSTTYTSNTVTATGYEPNTTFTVYSGGAEVDAGTTSLSGTFGAAVVGKTITTSGTGTFVVAMRRMSPATFSTTNSTSITVSHASGSANTVGTAWTITTRAADTDPNSFTNAFTDVTNAEPSTEYTSNTITLSGLEPNYSPITVSAVGGTVDAGTTVLSGSFAALKSVTSSASGTIVVRAKGTSPAGFSPNAQNVTVTCGNQSDVFRIANRAADVEPNPWTFGANVTNADLNTQYTLSPTATIDGLEPSTGHSMSFVATAPSEAQYQINGGAWTTITNSALVNFTTNGVGAFTLGLRLTTASVTNDTRSITATVGSVSRTWSVTTFDGIPDQFTFTDVTNAVQGTAAILSNEVTVTGLAANRSITVTGSGGTGFRVGTTSASWGTFLTGSTTVTTSASGTFALQARVTASEAINTTTSVTVTVGGVSDTFSVTTGDGTPNTFSFTSVLDAALSTTYTSNTVTLTGMTPNYTISVEALSGGTIDAGTSSLSGSFATYKSIQTSASGTAVIAARLTSASTTSTLSNVEVKVYGGTGNADGANAFFNVTTRQADSIPDNYGNDNVNGSALSTTYTSPTYTITGLEPSTSFSVSSSGVAYTAHGANIQLDVGTTSLSGSFASPPRSVTTSGSGSFVTQGRLTTSQYNSTTTGMTFTIAQSGNTPLQFLRTTADSLGSVSGITRTLTTDNNSINYYFIDQGVATYTFGIRFNNLAPGDVSIWAAAYGAQSPLTAVEGSFDNSSWSTGFISSAVSAGGSKDCYVRVTTPGTRPHSITFGVYMALPGRYASTIAYGGLIIQ